MKWGADVLARFKERVTVLSGELKACAKRPGEALVKASKIFVETVQRHVEGKLQLVAEAKFSFFSLTSRNMYPLMGVSHPL